MVNQLGFEFRDGRRVDCGGYDGGKYYDCAFEGHVVSQIYTTGPSREGQVLESVIYGFRIEESYPTPQEVAAKAMTSDFANSLAECYAIDPVWHDPDEVAKARHGLGLGAGQDSAVSGGELRWGYKVGDVGGPSFFFRGVELGAYSVKNPHTLEWAHQTGSVDMPFAAQLIFNADFTTLTGTFHFYEGGGPIRVKGQRLAQWSPRVDPNYKSSDR
jgi:hypothetical protein